MRQNLEQIRVTVEQKRYLESLKNEEDTVLWRVVQRLIKKAKAYDRAIMNDTDDGM